MRWHRRRIKLFSGEKNGIEKAWILSEVFCMYFSLVTFLSLLTTFILVNVFLLHVPDAIVEIALPLMTTAAIGYFTNFLAVTMLFRPINRRERLIVWRQGLIPKRKNDIASEVAIQISTKLLTAKVITEEVCRLAESAIDNPSFRKNIRVLLEPFVKENLPYIIKRIKPEVISLIKEGLRSSFNKEKIIEFIESVLGPWLSRKETREELVDEIVKIFKEKAPYIVDIIEKSIKKYSRQSFVKKAFVWIAKKVNALDWESVSRLIKSAIASEESRRQIVEAIADIVPRITSTLKLETEVKKYIRKAVEKGDLPFEPSDENIKTAIKAIGGKTDAIFEDLKKRTSAYAENLVADFLEENLPKEAEKLAGSKELWNWITNTGIPNLKPHIQSWLEENGLEFFGEHFDVKGRVEKSIRRMSVKTLHNMVDQVAAKELGRIQVLGYGLGLFLGCLLLRLPGA
jgi:uncharacterized membrane protein YheB (UPF0754 family)